MKQCGLSGILVLALSVAGVQSAVAQTSTFMLVPDIQGDSTQEHYENWIEVFSITQSFNAANKVSACSVVVAKGLDQSGPRLWAAAATGQVFPEIRIEILRAGGAQQRFYELTLMNASVSTITSAPSALTEQLTLSGTSATLRFFPQNADGSLRPPISSTISCK